MQLFDVVTTELLLWKRACMSLLEASTSSNWMVHPCTSAFLPWLWIISIDKPQLSIGMLQICMPTLGPSLCPRHLPEDEVPTLCLLPWSYWDHRWYRKDNEEHAKCLHMFMKVAQEHGLTFISDKCAVMQPSITILVVFIMQMESILTLQFTECQHPRQQLNCRGSSALLHICHTSYPHSPPLLHLCEK